MPNADASIRVDTRIDGSGINKGVKDIDASLSKVTSSLGKFGGALGSIVGVIVSAGEKLWNLASEVATAGDEIEKTSQKVGLSYKAYQKWDYAMKICGTEMSSCAVGLKTLTNTFDDAISGSSSATEKFERLGLSIDDLRGLSREDLFATVVTALQNVEGETEKAALANDLFGRSGQDLAPLLNLTADELGELMDEAEAYGIVMSDDAVKASAAFEDSLTKLEKTLDGLKAAVVGSSLPAITRLMDSASGAAAALTQYVKDCKDAFDKWLSTVDLGPLKKSVESLKKTLSDFFSRAKEQIDKIAGKLKPFLKWLIETWYPLLVGALNGIITAVGAVFNFVCDVVGGMIDAVTGLINIAKDAVAWLWQLFGMEPPEWTKHDDNSQPDYSGTQAQVDDLTASYEDLGDAAEDAEEAIEGAKDAADAGGSSGGSGGSEKGQDVLGFDAITKLSDQSGGSGGKGGGSGSGSADAAGEAGGAPYQAMATGADTAAQKNKALKDGAEDLGKAVDGLSLKIELLIDNLIDAVSHLDELFRPRKVDTTLNLKKGKDFDSLKKEWDELEDREITGTLKLENFDAPKLEDQDVTTTLNLKKGKDFDVLLAMWDDLESRSVTTTLKLVKAASFDELEHQWNNLADEQVLKELEAKLEVAIKTEVEVSVTTAMEQTLTQPAYQDDGFTGISGKIPESSGHDGSFGGGNGGSFGDRGSFGGGNGGSLDDAIVSQTGILDIVSNWWKGLENGKATKTLDLRGGNFQGGNGGGFSEGIRQWSTLTDGTATKTLDGKPTASLLSALKDWVQAKTETVKKTVDGSKTSGYTSILTSWSGWKNQTVVKTTKAEYGSSYKTALTSWSGWKNQTVVKTTKAEYGKNYQARLKEWVDIKDKNVEANLAINPTVSNMKSFLNSNIIEKLNRVFKKSLPDIRIPKLATGTIVNRATFAMIGENGPEAVMPLKNHTEWIDMLADRIAGRVGGSRQPMIVQVLMPDGRVLGETVVNYATSEAMRTGQLPWAAYE